MGGVLWSSGAGALVALVALVGGTAQLALVNWGRPAGHRRKVSLWLCVRVTNSKRHSRIQTNRDPERNHKAKNKI